MIDQVLLEVHDLHYQSHLNFYSDRCSPFSVGGVFDHCIRVPSTRARLRTPSVSANRDQSFQRVGLASIYASLLAVIKHIISSVVFLFVPFSLRVFSPAITATWPLAMLPAVWVCHVVLCAACHGPAAKCYPATSSHIKHLKDQLVSFLGHNRAQYA